ncbi:hypothetical protein E2I00_001418 [Balaenoptera physalus]|uniref:LTD domain-containing protein n=1 Tax=Balaenoptera physalus TaxID=9770 RepID=A0A643BZC8_BALPH|nr:hypothetical protein E2I00_001418 [Balaenoptera physalus]
MEKKNEFQNQEYAFVSCLPLLHITCSHALGDIKIAEVNVKGLFVKLINSSFDKELEIGNHILQQNVDGQRASLYQFLPNIIMQANFTVTIFSIKKKYRAVASSHEDCQEVRSLQSCDKTEVLICKSVEECAINTERVYDQTETEWLDMNLTKAETVYHSTNRKLYDIRKLPTKVKDAESELTYIVVTVKITTTGVRTINLSKT